MDKINIAKRAGAAARDLGKPFDSNPYPFTDTAATRREAWDSAWLDRDADIAISRQQDEQRQAQAEQWSKDADRVDGFDRDDLGESPDF